MHVVVKELVSQWNQTLDEVAHNLPRENLFLKKYALVPDAFQPWVLARLVFLKLLESLELLVGTWEHQKVCQELASETIFQHPVSATGLWKCWRCCPRPCHRGTFSDYFLLNRNVEIRLQTSTARVTCACHISVIMCQDNLWLRLGWKLLVFSSVSCFWYAFSRFQSTVCCAIEVSQQCGFCDTWCRLTLWVAFVKRIGRPWRWIPEHGVYIIPGC